MNYLGSNMQKGYNPHSLQKSLAWMAEAVQGEKEKEHFYEYLISIAPRQEDKDVIASIREDEVEHTRLFKQIYKDFTGQEIKEIDGEDFKKPDSYIGGIQQALFSELRAVEKYRGILKGLPEGYYRDSVFDILTDELRHSIKYNFLYTLNLTSGSKNNETI